MKKINTMRYFQNLEISHTNLMGRKEIKTINKQLIDFELNIKKEYKISKYKNKYFIISDDDYPMFFSINGIYYPTIKFLKKETFKYKVVILDFGAYKPILRGADIMAGGIFKNKDLCDDFKSGDVVIIKINDEIIGVGLAIIDKKDIYKDNIGKVIDVYHYLNDSLDGFSL